MDTWAGFPVLIGQAFMRGLVGGWRRREPWQKGGGRWGLSLKDCQGGRRGRGGNASNLCLWKGDFDCVVLCLVLQSRGNKAVLK